MKIIFLILLFQSVQASIAVSIPVQKKWLIELGIAKDELISVVPAGYAPEHYQPSPHQLAAFNHVQLYVRIGMPFEHRWIAKLRDVNAKMIVFNPLFEHDRHDPHFWLDPILLRSYLGHLVPVLAQIKPQKKAIFNLNYQHIAQKLTQLDKQLKKMLDPLKGRSFLTYHPAWAYFARRYGLHQISIEKEGKMPSPRYLDQLIRQAKQNNIPILLLQPQHKRRTAEKIARLIGAKIVLADPLAEDYRNHLIRLARILKSAYE